MSDIKWRNDGSGLGDGANGLVLHDMVNRLPIKGAKKGQDKARKPSIAKDTASSTSTVKILYILSEGEIAGLVDGGKSIYLDGTPLLDDAGNKNFEGVTWDFRSGTNEQEYIQGFPDVSNETPIGIELKSAVPYIKAFTDSQLSALRVRFKWNRLSKTNADNGDVTGYKIDYAIDLKTGSGAYVEVLKTKIEDKLSAGYERTHRIDLPKSSTGWQLRIRRLTPNDASEYIQDTMTIEAIAEVIDVKLAYPNTALLGIQYNAETFSNIAKMEVHAKGSIIRVPSNYNAVTRTYSGIWDGTFKDAYSNNPAWAYYYLCTQWRFGLGERLDATMIDKWSLYALGQYCDQMVSDGQGGLEPRFTCNVYLQKQEDAYKVLQNIAGIFRAMSYWNGERIVLDADVPQDPVYNFSRANVVDGNFEYTGTRARDRHTLAKVAWDNPANRFETEYEYIRDEKAMAKFGVKVLDLSAFGCTSQAQAQRAGLWALKTEQLETRQVGFSVGLDGFIPQIGNVINISDELFAGRANGGRVLTVNATQRIIELDREVIAAAGDVLIINGANGKSQRRNISNVVGNRITVTAAFDGAESEHVWAVETTDLKLMRFRVMSIQQNDDATFNITAIQHEPQKYDAIDFGTDVKPTDISIINPETVDAPASVTITSRHREVQGQTVTTLVIGWTQVSGAVAYDVEWRKDDGTWIRVPRTGNTSAEIEGVYSGQYQAQVRAVSAFDVQSKPTTSSLTEVKGKVGLPPTIVGLTAIGVLFGMDLKWSFAQGSGDAAYTEIQVGSAPGVNAATLTQVAYPTNTHNITGMQGGLSQSYRGRIVDKLGNVSAWSAWVTATTDNNAEKVLDLIQGQINESSLNTILKTKIADIKVTKDAIGNETTGIIADIIKANNRVTKEADDRIEALRLASLRTDGLQKSADDLAKDVGTVTVAHAQTAGGLAAVKSRADAFEIENGVQAQKLDYLSSELDMGFTDATQYTNKARGTVWTFAKTVAHADYVNSQLITGLSADYQNSSARFTENINLLTTKNEAVATKTTNLSTQMVGGYDGSDLTKLTSGLVFEESKARATDVEGLAEQISLLSAGVGEQFDSFEIWHFNKDAEGWAGAAYADGWLNVKTQTLTSPAVEDLDGAVYKHVKLRVKKVGNPIWQGLLSYAGGSLAVNEPSYDEDGIALANWQLSWTGVIPSFSIKLASIADAANYFLVDWIAVGRPSPAASNASLLRESKVRASETGANASDLVSLRAKIEGGNGVPVESSIDKKLETTANLASTTASDLTKLTSKYEGDMYGYEGTVQTTARTLASETQATADKLESLSANIIPKYTDATKFTNLTRGVQWTYAKTVAADNYAANQRITNLQSDFVNSSANVNNELFTLTEKDKSIAASVTQLYAKTDENYGLIQDISLAISKPESGLAAKVTELEASTLAAERLLTKKGEIIFSYGAPPVSNQSDKNVWFKLKNEVDDTVSQTPYRWNGTAWVELKGTDALEAKAAAAAAKGIADKGVADAKTAKEAADTAQGVADTAKGIADTATGKLNDISADDKLTAIEKQQTKTILSEITSSNSSVLASALKYGVSSVAYTTAYNKLTAYVNALLTSMTTTSNIVRATFNTNFAGLFAAKAELLNAVNTAAKAVADAAQITANTKGETIYSATAPSADKRLPQNVWYKIDGETVTAHVWVTNAWIPLTDKLAAQAVSEAGAAAQAAQTAQGDADTANGKVNDISSDSKLTAVEKQQTKVIVSEIKLTNTSILAQALKYEVSSAGYITAYNALVAYIDPKLVDMSATSTIVRSAFDSRFNDLFTARASLYSSISTAAKALADAAKAAADKANTALLPKNLATLVEGSGAFTTEFGAVSGKFANMQTIVDGQKTAMEVISAVGNAEKLKNEVAKARLDKNTTNLNAQSVALTNQIDSYTAKIADLVAKRDTPKKADVTQEQYIALKAEYNKQIADITAAKADLTAQKALITPQIAQLAAEKKVLDNFKEIEDNVKAQHTIKIDAGDGTVVGYGLVLDKSGVSDFNIRANNINFLPPKGGDDGVSQFVVRNTASVIDGVTVPAGVYARHFYAPKASIGLIQIDTATIGSLSALSATIGHFKSAETGARLEIKDSLLSVYDANNILRVRLGLW